MKRTRVGDIYNRKTNNDKFTKKILNSILALSLISVLSLSLSSLGVFSSKTSLKLAHSKSTQIINILTPTANSTVSNTALLSADLNNSSTSNYTMFWYVNNGSWNWMGNSSDGLSKQASINFSSWNWNAPTNLYTITIVAVMNGNNQRYYGGVPFYVNNTVPSTTTTNTSSSSSTSTTTTTSPVSTVSTPTTVSSSPLALYTTPNTSASQTANSTTDPTMKRIMTKIADQPTADWFGSWDTNIQSDVNSLVTSASNNNQMPVLVTYNIPERDCGSYSSGGATSASAYQSWISSFASGIGTKPAIVILEPDALAQISCLSSSDQTTRYQLLNYAVDALKANPNTKVYLDAGNPSWINASDMANRLITAGVNKSNGFSLNISNFVTTSLNETYGQQISTAIGTPTHFVIDTGRDGNGSNGQWCNPLTAALGNTPTSNTGNNLVDYFLWVKPPGESDGPCNGGPAAGSWWPQYGETLGLNAGW